MSRSFTAEPAVRSGKLPLMISLIGYAHSGKTYSGLTLATGIQKVVGGEIHVIGTEGDTALMYADDFRFKHVRLDAPYGSADYMDAINYCADRTQIIMIDNMSYEHTGEGGVLDSYERIAVDRVARAKTKPWNRDKEDWEIAESLGQVIWKEAKEPRKRLERRMEYLRDRGTIFILTYRADEKYVPKKRGEQSNAPDHQWKVEGTSQLPFISNLRWLLKSGCDGVATFVARSVDEAKLVKTPGPYRQFMKENQAITVELGENIARFARGNAAPKAPAVLSFRPTYKLKGEIAAADLPDVAEYITWLEERLGALSGLAHGAVLQHLTDVQTAYATMLAAESG